MQLAVVLIPEPRGQWFSYLNPADSGSHTRTPRTVVLIPEPRGQWFSYLNPADSVVLIPEPRGQWFSYLNPADSGSHHGTIENSHEERKNKSRGNSSENRVKNVDG
ncbi:hypothetical protein RRG08_015720 [Elysia crispata]|uniref:Uncharacterized protein n=1 Tax=Elysia crispata TaxID=231223 RepID=A0AAE0Z501_9GAST|nr:hypothetical protein RRG08_015720 [Elysia crispata]